MRTIRVRNLPDLLKIELKSRAKAHNLTVGEEVLRIIKRRLLLDEVEVKMNRGVISPSQGKSQNPL